jgi:hypothetical protein
MNARAAGMTIVRPASARLESLVILCVVVVLVAGSVLLARTNAQAEHAQVIQDWQVNSFDLSPVDRGNISALLFAGDIIQVWYADAYASGEPHWSTVEELENEEVGLAPFMKDVSWKQGGEVQWRLLTSYDIDGTTVYYGSHGKAQEQSAYLLVITHFHKGASYRDQSVVWVHRNTDASPPGTVNLDSLVRNGWKQVVPYRGSDEVKRLRGEE